MYYFDPLQSLNSTVLFDLFGVVVSIGMITGVDVEKIEHLYDYLVG